MNHMGKRGHFSFAHYCLILEKKYMCNIGTYYATKMNVSYVNILEERDYSDSSTLVGLISIQRNAQRSQSSTAGSSNCCVLEAWLADAFFSPELANPAGWNMAMCVSVTVLSYRNVFKRAVSVSRVTSTALGQLGQDGRRPMAELCHMMKDKSAQEEDPILPSRPLSAYTARGHTFSEN